MIITFYTKTLTRKFHGKIVTNHTKIVRLMNREICIRKCLGLRAWGGHLSTFILKWLTQTPDLVKCDWFALTIYDPRSRTKGVQTLKRPLISKFWSRTEIFYDSSKSYHTGFLLWLIEIIFYLRSFKSFQIILARAKKGDFFLS